MKPQRAAVIVGIDHYKQQPLTGCVADAKAIAAILARNDDQEQSANFQREVYISSEKTITKAELVAAFVHLFSIKNADVAVFYFAGHGAHTKSGGFLVTQDAQTHDEGVPMSQLITAANESPAGERIIILDCCHAGAVDELFGSAANIPLSQGVSILAACRTDEGAAERNGRGLFTSLICDALSGGSADIRGFVTVPDVYAYVDELLNLFKQTPLFKANVSKLIPIRRAASAIPDDTLRKLATYFPSEKHRLQLDPSFEPTSPNPNEDNTAIFANLQKFRAARLVIPDGEEHLYYAAMNSKTCSLTPLGQYYWRCVKAGKI